MLCLRSITKPDILLLCLTVGLTGFYPTTESPPMGISRLITGSNRPLQAFVPKDVRPLISPSEQEAFLSELEIGPPDWSQLQDQEGEEHGERLFAFNRQRNEARDGHALLDQRVAFVWSGILRQYDPILGGFRIAIGPEFTKTHWGTLRFKPMGLPDDMVAIPAPPLRTAFRKKLKAGEQVEIYVLFFGHLIPNESIMYGFSHDDPGQGMIMPVVHIDDVRYVLPSPKPPQPDDHLTS